MYTLVLFESSWGQTSICTFCLSLYRNMPVRDTFTGKDYLIAVVYCREEQNPMPDLVGLTEIAK